MKLEEIGFYTLSDDRARNASEHSPLWRAELILTDKCNFACSYCRGIKKEYAGNLSYEDARNTVSLWLQEGLQNIRFSGGEPTLYKQLPALVSQCREGGVKHIAISTNGSLPTWFYDNLVDLGVNDFSISLDACCASLGDKMAGGILGAWDKVVANIKHLSQKTYVTVGIVLTDDNVEQLRETVEYAHSLGVADIRVIPAAQYSEKLMESAKSISQEILNCHPILKYRIQNLLENKPVRGIPDGAHNRCPLVLDDVASAGGHHFPCIIYLREQGKPVGKLGPDMRKERAEWARDHNTHQDPICKKNCLDVCQSYISKWMEFQGNQNQNKSCP